MVRGEDRSTVHGREGGGRSTAHGRSGGGGVDQQFLIWEQVNGSWSEGGGGSRSTVYGMRGQRGRSKS